MPTINIDREAFEGLVGKKLDDEKLKDRISMLGTDLEKVDDKEIIVEVFPNRPDMLSEEGFARAFSSFIGVKTGLKKYEVKKSNFKVKIEGSVKNVRPYTSCAIVKNLELNEERIKSIIQLQEKLHVTYGRNRRKVAIGIYPLEAIKLPIIYKAEDPKKIFFVPLDHGDGMNGEEILEKHKAGKEYGHLLEGMKKYPIFIDAKNSILSMPPIINSEDTGRVTEETKEVFVECSGFDFETSSKCLNMIVTTLADMGAEIYEMELEFGSKKIKTPKLNPEKWKLNKDKVNKVLGLNLKENAIKILLERMGYSYSKGSVLVPAYRGDILHEVDIITDIGIAYGFENFEEEIPNVSTNGEESKEEKIKRKIAEILIGMDLLEVSTYHLSNEEILNKKMLINESVVKVKNAVNEDYDSLRNNLFGGMLKIFSENKHYEYPQKIFEIGNVFLEGESETNVLENEKLNVSLAGNKEDFTKIRQVLEGLMESLGLEIEVQEFFYESFIEGRMGRILLNKKPIGLIGEIHPQVLENFELENPVSCFEIDLSEVFEKFK